MKFLPGLSNCCQDTLPPPPARQRAEEDAALLETQRSNRDCSSKVREATEIAEVR